ncbi:MAG: 2,3,4,5-tetrahydropyridine-2,6-dicarboxylate N-succinyltransferase [Actinomycetes bacterium]
MENLRESIEDLYARIGEISPKDLEAKALVEAVIAQLDAGELRVAEHDQDANTVSVNAWVKYAILLFFRLQSMQTMECGPFEYYDKIPLKRGYAAAGVRAVPGASVRYGAHVEAGAVLMPSYVNIGARVGADSMVDTWATVGSCAQIGKRVHLAGGVGIGGVLEPPNAAPVVVGDDAFIGSRCMVTDGAIVGAGAVLGSGTILNPSIPVINAQSGAEISRGVVPPWSVAVTASRAREFAGGTFYLPCVLVIKTLAAGERHDKAQLNDVLREHGVAT